MPSARLIWKTFAGVAVALGSGLLLLALVVVVLDAIYGGKGGIDFTGSFVGAIAIFAVPLLALGLLIWVQTRRQSN
jgi:hypothetical protein